MFSMNNNLKRSVNCTMTYITARHENIDSAELFYCMKWRLDDVLWYIYTYILYISRSGQLVCTVYAHRNVCTKSLQLSYCCKTVSIVLCSLVLRMKYVPIIICTILNYYSDYYNPLYAHKTIFVLFVLYCGCNLRH